MTNSMTDKKKRALLIAAFLTFVFALLTAWAVIQPLNASPDEGMRYQIVEYLVKHGTLPDGRDPEIRNELWGISYAFSPILAYMFMAVPAKITSLFTSSPEAILLAARMVNVLFGTIMAYLTLRIGEMLFKGREKWMFTCLVTFLPGLVFVHSYVNNDSMALLSTAWIVYSWVRSMKEGWSVKVCVHLALAISLCGLSYYNAYGFVLCSMFFLASTILFCSSGKKDFRFLFARGGLIAAIVLVLIGWWFIRNAILYDGDFLGWFVSTDYAEMYAIEELKPSNRQTPQTMGMSLIGMMLMQPGGWPHNWVMTVVVSFVGTFGFMNIFMPEAVSKIYILFFAAGMTGIFLNLRATFSPRIISVERKREHRDTTTWITKKIVRHPYWRKESVFHLSMLAAMIIPCILLLRYSYANDLQAQGRYVLPMLIPFMYFVTYGYRNLLDRFVKKEAVKNWFYAGVCVLSILGVLYTYIWVFLPNYR